MMHGRSEAIGRQAGGRAPASSAATFGAGISGTGR
ncbi:hypothetical protein C7450_101901 [Chelatococcus asaccharovorans]|uniref:Uncharacterized protein n=1 Tax=Chelatococcus asaccharovorans TaxID=28210 RepID=A0A2V3UWS4_9HYPH|nr:hypothetical protein C7450_101901 [Chelatococcus asaccharovorans]